MSTVLRVDASIREAGSVTRAVANTLESALVSDVPDVTIVRRELGLTPIPSTTWAASAFGGYTPEDMRTDEQKQGIAFARELGDELEKADAYIFAIPLYNFGVSQHAKTWIDILLSEPRFATKPEKPIIAGRPAYLVIARGGGYGPGTPRAGWDHATGWLTRILVDVWGLDVQIVESELTLADTNPAMFSLRDLAAQNLKNAHELAAKFGHELADKLMGAAVEAS